MRTRRLPRRNLIFTDLGFGAAPIGNLGRSVSDGDARAALQAARDGGIRYVDTAPHYGLGLSERRVGAVLAGWPREEVLLSTKVGRLLEPLPGQPTTQDDQNFDVPRTHRRVWDFSKDGVRRSLEASLERLGLDRIDIVLVHDPDDHWEQASEQAIPALAALRDQGVIGAIGVGMNQTHLPTRFVRETDIDVVMLAGRYTLLDHDLALETLLPAALEEGVGIIAAGVFNSGLLAGPRPRPGATFDYAPAPPEVFARAEHIADVCRDHGTTAAAAALHFVLAHPAVTTAVLGMRNAEQAIDNLSTYATPPEPALWDALRRDGILAGSAPTPD